jgi:tetratricopeptide (TPR) repeat protein
VSSDASVAELCARLDNLPLAVELAAARASVLAPEQILRRLSQRLDLLKGGQDSEARQQTLRATIAWSHDLLSEGERALFARLSIFVASFSLEAAEVVCEAAVDTLQSLVDKSLVHRTGNRFAMLETIREYAAEQLGQLADGLPLVERLAGYLIDLIDAEGPPMFLGRQSRVFELLEHEHPHTRLVMDWAFANKRYEIALRLVATLFVFWNKRGHSAEARPWAEAALSAREAMPVDLQLRMLVGASEILRATGDVAVATTLKEELLERAAQSELSDPLWVPALLVNLAEIAMETGELTRARRLAEQSLELRVQRGLPPARAQATLGELARREGDVRLAEELYCKAARGFVEMQDDNNAASAFRELGELARRKGEGRNAIDLFRKALRLSVDLRDVSGIGNGLQDVAVVAWSCGEVQRAARLWGAGQRVLEDGGCVSARGTESYDLPEPSKREGAAMRLEDVLVLALDGESTNALGRGGKR